MYPMHLYYTTTLLSGGVFYFEPPCRGLLYVTKVISQLEKSAVESWYTDILTLHDGATAYKSHVGLLLYLNADFKKCITHHIPMNRHQVITICFQI